MEGTDQKQSAVCFVGEGIQGPTGKCLTSGWSAGNDFLVNDRMRVNVWVWFLVSLSPWVRRHEFSGSLPPTHTSHFKGFKAALCPHNEGWLTKGYG